jgi:hypothetical protein
VASARAIFFPLYTPGIPASAPTEGAKNVS